MANQISDTNEENEVQYVRRSAVPLYLIFITVGILTDYFMAPSLQKAIKHHIGNLSITWTMILFGILCLIISIFLAMLVSEIYTTSRFGWLSLLAAALIPIVAAIISSVIVAIIAAIIGIIGLAIVVFLLICSGGGTNGESRIYFLDDDGNLW